MTPVNPTPLRTFTDDYVKELRVKVRDFKNLYDTLFHTHKRLQYKTDVLMVEVEDLKSELERVKDERNRYAYKQGVLYFSAPKDP